MGETDGNISEKRRQRRTMKKKRVMMIKIRDKKTENEQVILMGDNYKPFEEHFLDIINMFTENWKYDDTPQGAGRCLGRILTVDFLEMFEANERYPSYGGPKMIHVDNYDKQVQDHNRNGDYKACKYLKDIRFTPVDKKVLEDLLKNCNVIDEKAIEQKENMFCKT